MIIISEVKKFSAGLLAIADGKVLLGFRSSTVDNPHTWAVIGGGSEKGETPSQTAKREFKEETKFEGSLNISPVYLDERKKDYHVFKAQVAKFEAKVDDENDRFGWFTLAEVKELKQKHFGIRRLLDARVFENIL